MTRDVFFVCKRKKKLYNLYIEIKHNKIIFFFFHVMLKELIKIIFQKSHRLQCLFFYLCVKTDVKDVRSHSNH